MKPDICFRCGNVITNARGYGHVSWGAGDTELEQLRSWRQHRICDSCIEPLQAWLGIPPQPPPLPEPEPPKPVVMKVPRGCAATYI